MHISCVLFRVPTVREKSGKSGKNSRSGNFKLSQGNLKYLQMSVKVREFQNWKQRVEQ